MIKKIMLPLAIIIIYLSTFLLNAKPVTLPELPKQSSVLLMPLDSRPVCSTMVQKLGQLAGINVIVPPKELLDNYQDPADREKLWQWLQNNAGAYDSGIISTDILLHGSLLRTRQHVATAVEQDVFFKELEKLSHTPQLSLFSVIPRLLVSDEIYPDCWYQWHLMRYSQLLDMVQINGDYAMTKKLLEYKGEIPADILKKYTSIFTQSQGFNERLLAYLLQKTKNSKNMVNTQVKAEAATNSPLVIIGQDDSSPFGLPRITGTNLEQKIHTYQLNKHAQLTCGADEVAALLLTRRYLQQKRWQPKIFLQFATPGAEFKHMPYMADSTGACLRNQIELIGAKLTSTKNNADIIVFVHCGDENAKPTASEARELKHLLASGKQVALIDLSANFEAEEMLLPELLKQDIPVNKLAAYAGWNTFSNSSGTALAQSVIFAGRLRELEQSEAAQSFTGDVKQTKEQQTITGQDKSAAIASLYAANLNFTIERMLEDYYYQKRIHPELRPYLESFGTTPTDLEPEEKQQTEYRILERLALYADLLFWRSLSRTPFYTDTRNSYYLADLTVGAKLPWNRIFEVDLNVHSKYSRRPIQH